MADTRQDCPHCGSRLRKWRVPDEATWEEEFFFVCFSDECPYFRGGWEWIKEKYQHRASYRYALNPTTGASLPLPVWSESAIRELIVDEAEGDGE